jgi:DNA replicative helicase MCM subunit Mcm2 (Cdc46/Mcm family)
MFTPHIVENENTKEGLLMVFANAGIPNDRNPNNYTRHRIHQLLIGDPGEAKSRFVSYIADSKIIPGARYESAQSSTGLSLTAQVDKEGNGSRYTLRRGPLALARGSICALNEIDKMKSLSEHHHFLDTMEEGEFTINKYGKHYKIPANTSVVASANPINQKWKDTKRIDLNEILTIEQNIQRFDIISVFRAPTSKAGMIKYLRQKREVERKYAAGEFDDYTRFLRNYFKYVRGPLFSTIMIKKEAEDMLDTYVYEMPDRGITGLKRRRESLRRLIISRARLKLKKIADEEDAEEVMKFYNVMLMHEEKTIVVSKRPMIETYDACIEILKKNKSFRYSYIELMETVRKDSKTSEQVKEYIGSRDLDMEHNRNVRNVVELLQQHSNIRQTRDRPITLQWVDDDTPKSDDDIPSVDIPPVNPQPTDTSIGAQTQTQETSKAQQHNTSDGTKFDPIQKEDLKGSLLEYLQTFDELAGRNERHLVPGEKFREALLSSGLSQSDAAAIIIKMEMAKDGIEEFSHLIEGLQYPTYRRKCNN